jgi:hypothetical protein
MIRQLILLISLFVSGPILINLFVLRDSYEFPTRLIKYLYSFVLSWVCLFVYLQILFQLKIPNLLIVYFSSLLILTLCISSVLLVQYFQRKSIFQIFSGKLAPYKTGVSATIFSFFLLILGFSLIVVTISIPYFENDSLEYLRGGIELLSAGNLSNYPFINNSNSDLFLPSSHPPTFHLFLGLVNQLFGGILLAKIITVMFFLAIIAPPLNLIANPYVYVLSFLSVPLLVFSTFTYPMDVNRISVYWVAFSLLFIQQKSHEFNLIRSVFILSVVSSTHSLGLLLQLIMILILYWKHHFKLLSFALFFIFFSLVMSPQYLRNFFQTGNFISDNWTSSPSLAPMIMKDLSERRELDGFPNILTNGLFSPVFHPRFFGFVFPILLVQIIVFVFRNFQEKSLILTPNFLMVLMYFSIASSLTFLGDLNLVKNFRYPLTILPNIIFLIFTLDSRKRQYDTK